MFDKNSLSIVNEAINVNNQNKYVSMLGHWIAAVWIHASR